MLPFAEQGYKDPMHGNEHGNSMLSVKCSVIKLRNIGEELNLRPDVFIKRLKTRLLGLCDSSSVQHLTLLTLGNQKILEGLEVIDKEVRTKTKTRSQPIVDANDVSKLLLTLIFVLDGVVKPELDAFNRRQVRLCFVCKWCASPLQMIECISSSVHSKTAFSVLMSVKGVQMFCIKCASGLNLGAFRRPTLKPRSLTRSRE